MWHLSPLIWVSHSKEGFLGLWFVQLVWLLRPDFSAVDFVQLTLKLLKQDSYCRFLIVLYIYIFIYTHLVCFEGRK